MVLQVVGLCRTLAAGLKNNGDLTKKYTHNKDVKCGVWLNKM
jgi:hypothetical protein